MKINELIFESKNPCIVKKLFKQYGGKKYKLSELSVPCQKAIIHYFAWDGEAWDIIDDTNSTKDINNNLDKYIKKYGNQKFGYVELPLDIVDKHLFDGTENEGKRASEVKGFLTWTHRSHGARTSNEIQPIFLSSVGVDDMGLIEDGWNRVSWYIKNKIDPIPCILTSTR